MKNLGQNRMTKQAVWAQPISVFLCLLLAFPASILLSQPSYAQDDGEKKEHSWRRAYRPSWSRSSEGRDRERDVDRLKEEAERQGENRFARTSQTVTLIALASIASMMVEERNEAALHFEDAAGESVEGDVGSRVDRQRRVVDLPHWEGFPIKIPLSEAGDLFLGKSDESWWQFEDAPRGWVKGRLMSMGSVFQVAELLSESGDSLPFDPALVFLENPDPDPQDFSDFESDRKETEEFRCDYAPYAGRCAEIYELRLWGKVQRTAGYVIDSPLFAAIAVAGGWETILKKIPGFERGFKGFVKLMDKGAGKFLGQNVGKSLLVEFMSHFAHMSIIFPAWEAGGFLFEMAITRLEPQEAARARGLMFRMLNDYAQYDLLRNARMSNEALAGLGAKSRGRYHDVLTSAEERAKSEFQKDVKVFGRIFEEIWVIVALDPGLRKRLVAGLFRERLHTGEFLFTMAGLSTAGLIQRAGAKSAVRGVRLTNVAYRRLQKQAVRDQVAKKLGLAVTRTASERVRMRALLGASRVVLRLASWSRAGLVFGGFFGAVVFVSVILVVDYLIPEAWKEAPTRLFKRVATWHGARRQRGAQKELSEALHREASEQEIRKIIGKLIRARQHQLSQINHLRDHTSHRLEKTTREAKILAKQLRERLGYFPSRSEMLSEMRKRFNQAFNPYRETLAPYREAMKPANPVDRMTVEVHDRLTLMEGLSNFLHKEINPRIWRVYDRELDFLFGLIGKKWSMNVNERIETDFEIQILGQVADWNIREYLYEEFINWIRPQLPWSEPTNRIYLQYFMLTLISYHMMRFLVLVHSPEAKVLDEYKKIVGLDEEEGGDSQPSKLEEELGIMEWEIRARTRIFGWEELRLVSGGVQDLRTIEKNVLDENILGFMPSSKFGDEYRYDWFETFGLPHREKPKPSKDLQPSLLQFKM